MFDVTKLVGELFGKKYKLPKPVTPKWLTILIGLLFGVTRKFIRRNVGYRLITRRVKKK